VEHLIWETRVYALRIAAYITVLRRFYTFAVISYVARKLRSRVYTQLQPECISFIADPLDAKTQARAMSLKIPRNALCQTHAKFRWFILSPRCTMFNSRDYVECMCILS